MGMVIVLAGMKREEGRPWQGTEQRNTNVKTMLEIPHAVNRSVVDRAMSALV